MNSFVITPFVNPIALITEISLHCSYRFPVIEDDSEKKQINIVIEITTLKIISSVFSAYKNKKEVIWVKLIKRVLSTYITGIVKGVHVRPDGELVLETFLF